MILNIPVHREILENGFLCSSFSQNKCLEVYEKIKFAILCISSLFKLVCMQFYQQNKER